MVTNRRLCAGLCCGGAGGVLSPALGEALRCAGGVPACGDGGRAARPLDAPLGQAGCDDDADARRDRGCDDPDARRAAALTAGAQYYVIASGDTLDAIASRFATTVDALLRLNPGIEPTTLRPGEQVRVK